MKRILSAVLALILVSAAAILSSCGGSDAAADSAKDTATESTAEVSTDTETETDADTETEAETESAAADTSSESGAIDAETVEESIDFEKIKDELGSKAAGFLKRMLFEDESGEHNWYEFYNSCITGKISLSDGSALVYARECLEFFEENGLETEAAQARTVIDAAEALIGQ